jgi:antitoxin VapB
MPLNIKNTAVELLVADVARTTGESKTEAIRRALEDRKRDLAAQGAPGSSRARFLRFLASEVWPTIPRREMRKRWSRAKLDRVLGFGRDGL